MSPRYERVQIPPGASEEFEKFILEHGGSFEGKTNASEDDLARLNRLWAEQAGKARELVQQFSQRLEDPQTQAATVERVQQLVADAFINNPFKHYTPVERLQIARETIRTDTDWDATGRALIQTFTDNLPDSAPDDITLAPTDSPMQPFRSKGNIPRVNSPRLFPRDIAFLIQQFGLHGEKPKNIAELQREGTLVRRTGMDVNHTSLRAIWVNGSIRTLVLKDPRQR